MKGSCPDLLAIKLVFWEINPLWPCSFHGRITSSVCSFSSIYRHLYEVILRKFYQADEVAKSDGWKIVKLISVKMPEAMIEGMDELVRRGVYPSRSAVMRTAVRDLLKKELWK